MLRYTCTFCGKKRSVEKLVQIKSDISKKKTWICINEASNFTDIHTIRVNTEKPVFVELFSGSKHISNAAALRGFETISVDCVPKFKPTICKDIQNLKRGDLPGNVHVLWASVPCTTYSVLSLAHHWQTHSIGYRNYYYTPKTPEAVETLRILNKTCKLIAQINPIYYFIENPRGALRHMPQMRLIPYRRTVSYADYGFDYYKPTDIFTNCKDFKPKQITGCVGRTFDNSIKDMNGAYERSLVPGLLIDEIFNSFSGKFFTDK
jgi:site-specific DNA-cytosine methylase